MLENEIWGNSIQNWIISILIIVAAIVLVKLISLLSKKVLKPLTDRTKNHLDDIIFYSLEPPIKFAIILLGIWIAIHRLVYPDSFVKVVDNIYRILMCWILPGCLPVYSAVYFRFIGDTVTVRIIKCYRLSKGRCWLLSGLSVL